MGHHDHPEACQHTVALCSDCNTCYCTVCGVEWVQLRLPSVVDSGGQVLAGAGHPGRNAPYGPPAGLSVADAPVSDAEHTHAVEAP